MEQLVWREPLEGRQPNRSLNASYTTSPWDVLLHTLLRSDQSGPDTDWDDTTRVRLGWVASRRVAARQWLEASGGSRLIGPVSGDTLRRGINTNLTKPGTRT